MAAENKPFTGSYSKEDVVFLLKNISDSIIETDTEDKEEAIQSGVHYSEMLPVEYKPTENYINLFHKSLEESARKVALAVAVVSEKIISNRGKDIVLVSLARAGTPIGILIKRYLENNYGIKLPHYSVSIIRGKGIDENAIAYILKQHPEKEVQFIDGWTGKGAITRVLIEACKQIKESLGVDLNSDLAVLADPAYCTTTFGTREDFLIPSACLNSTVSGLVSRTVHREDLIGPNDFHGAKFYEEMKDDDVSNLFIDRITEEFSLIQDEIEAEINLHKELPHEVTWKGLKDIEIIQTVFGIEDINLIKPGIGETTRVLLRRVPWKVLVRDYESDNLKHILLLAKDRGVPVVEYPHMTYECCGLIKPLKE
nr:cysteine protease StiP family protein [Alkaliphilus flagellatus]